MYISGHTNNMTNPSKKSSVTKAMNRLPRKSEVRKFVREYRRRRTVGARLSGSMREFENPDNTNFFLLKEIPVDM